MQRNSSLLELNEIMDRKLLQIWACSSVVEPLPRMDEYSWLGPGGDGGITKKEKKEGREKFLQREEQTAHMQHKSNPSLSSLKRKKKKRKITCKN